MIPRFRKPASQYRSERGYILITLILCVALIAIAALVTAPLIAFQVKRDREEELIHRGVQYSRAMKHFVKKFGRYPTRIEELENTNQVRFLRKRYKDPITRKDFKLLHMGEVQLSFGAGIGGATPAGLNPGAPGVAGGPGGPGGLGPGAINTLAAAGGLAAAGTITAQAAGGPGVSTSAATNAAIQQNPDQSADTETAGATPTQGANAAPTSPGAPGAGPLASSNPGAQVFGGGPIVGVASTSKDKSIRIFNKKDHYNDWQFIYDPTTDRGGLLTTPNQPSLQGATAAIQGAPGTPGAPGSPGGIPGQPGSGFQPGQPNQPGLQPQMPPDQGP